MGFRFAMWLLVFLMGLCSYGSTLGTLLRGTPISMGVIWLVLVLESACFAHLLVKNRWVATVLGTALIIGIVVLVEPIAARYQLWIWEGDGVPVQNYFAWGGVAFLFQYAYHTLGIEQGTKVSVYLLLGKIIFIIIA